MADQIVDKKSIGIPEDIAVIRGEVEELRDQTVASSRDAANSEALARKHASDAREAAEESRAWAEVRHLGVHFSDRPPEEVVDGMTWFVTDEDQERIVAIRRYDASSKRWCVFPSDETYPSDSLYPREVGEWVSFRIAPEVLA